MRRVGAVPRSWAMPRRLWALAAFLVIACGEGSAIAQSSFETVTTLNSTPGQAVVTEVRPVRIEPGQTGPSVLQFSVGFGTDEVFGPGTIFDAFSLTLQTADASRTWLLATFDASGVVWAPLTPGTTPFDESAILRTAVQTPNGLPDFKLHQAFSVEIQVPDNPAGQPLNLYFDLANNQNSVASQGWFSEVVLVPEPGVTSLGILGAVLALAAVGREKRARLRRMAVRGGGRLLALLAPFFFLTGPAASEARAQDELAFTLGDASFTLIDVTPNTAVYFTSLRLNRALNVWNIDVTLSNRSAATVVGPMVLLVDSVSGSSGVQAADGVTGGKAFFDFSPGLSERGLKPGDQAGPRTLTLGRSGNSSPVLTTKVYAGKPPVRLPLGFTRTLDEAGQPLPGVTFQAVGSEAAASPPAPSRTSDLDSGVASFTGSAGERWFKFSRDGYLPVWRRQVLTSNEPVVFPNPRLTQRAAWVAATPLGGTVLADGAGGIQVSIPAGALGQAGQMTLTPLTGQTLPALLPLGWSPLVAFWLEATSPWQGALPATIKPGGFIGAADVAAVVRWDDASRQWMTAQLVSGRGSNAVEAALSAPGAYALVAGDGGDWAPPAPRLGEALAAGSGAAIAAEALTATGSVTPSVSAASVVPAQVTARAGLEVRHPSLGVPSGYLLRGEVTETYQLADGSLRQTPQYEQHIVVYQRPGDSDPLTAHATFPMRPLLLFGPERLGSAAVNVSVLADTTFDGSVLDSAGGQIANNGLRILAGTGRLAGPSAIQLRPLDRAAYTNLLDGFSSIVAAFELTLDRSTLVGPLGVQMIGLPTNTWFVLARVLSETGFYGLQPVERLHSDAAGRLTSVEPATGARLPGLDRSGQFTIVQVSAAQTLVEGVARNGSGQVQAKMPVGLVGLPWLTLSGADGRFQLVGPAGSRQLTVRDPATGDTGLVSVTLGDPSTPVSQDLASAPSGPRVARLTPANGSTKVPRVGSVVIEFSEAVNPATVVNAVQLLNPDDTVVPAALTLNLANRVATLTPAAELSASTRYRVRLSSGIQDLSGMAIEGETEFSFTTVAASTRVSTAQLVIYAPGATNVPAAILGSIPAYEPGNDPFAIVVHGEPGVADPEVPVILANESTGETSTVLSKVDGSFSSVITGKEEDFVSATFVNLNGTRVYVPVSRQQFDNGFVGLYPQGGILEAQSDGGPVKVIIAPNSIPSRTKLKVDTLSLAQLLAQLGGVTPTNATIAGSGLNLRIEGPAPTLPVQVRFPVNLTSFGYPTNEAPTNAAAAVAVVRNSEDGTAFEMMDQLLFTREDGGEPVLRPANNNNQQLAAGFLNTSVGLVIPALGPTVGGAVQIGFNQVLVPLLFGPRPVVIKGKVGALPMELAVGLQNAGVFNQILNAQTGVKSIDIPYTIAQQMGLANPLQVFGGLAQQVIGVGVTAFEQQLIVLSKPLSGALVTVRLAGGPLQRLRGRLFPGMVYSTSGADGYFLTVAPAAGANYLLNATHPLYQERLEEPVNPINIIPGQGGDLTLAGAVYKNLYFWVPNDTETPPSVSIANTPVRPAPGQSCQLVVDATLQAGSPKISVRIKTVGTNNLGTGQAIPDAHATLSVITNANRGNSARWTGTVTVDQPVSVLLTVVVDGPNGEQDAILPYPIYFSGAVPTTPNTQIPAPDTNDVHGPLVVETRPSENGYVGGDGEVTIFFNKPIDARVTNDLFGVTLSGVANAFAVPNKPVVTLTARQQILTLRYPGLSPGATYRLTLSGQSIRDLAGQPLDQRPSTTDQDSFTMTFRTAPAAEAALAGVANGRGAAISGPRLYVLDQSAQGSFLVTYDISSPLDAHQMGRFPLKGTARDLIVVPQFGYKLNATAPVETNDLVVVVGGDLDALINQVQGTTVDVPGQYIWVINMGDPAAPRVLASPVVSYRVGSAVTEVRWAPPYVVYLEFGADIQLLGFVNLQEMLFGFNSPEARRRAFPEAGRPGVDLNADGDYVDPGETLPLPQFDPVEFYGKSQNFVIQNTTQKILDFSVAPGGDVVGVTLRSGTRLDDQGHAGAALPAMYRTLVYNGLSLNIAEPLSGMYKFFNGAYPRWVSVFNSVQLLVDGAPTTRSLALVSLTPNTNGVQAIAVIDISLPLQPQLIQEIVIPDELLGGSIGNITRRADGLLEVAGGQNVVLLNPRYLAVTDYPRDQLPPAIAGVVAGAGSPLRNTAGTDYGVHAVAEGGRTAVVVSAPELRLVSFPEAGALIDPERLKEKDGASLAALLGGLNPLNALAPANVVTNESISSDLNPPNMALHYHVLVRAPGGAGDRIELGLESLNPAGRPLANLGVGFAPVRAVSEGTQTDIGQTPRAGCGAPIRSLPAFRVSADPHSEFYTWYLSRPFTLITAAATLSDLGAWKGSAGVDREILFSGSALRAFIDPRQSPNHAIGAFAARVDPRSQTIFPVSSAVADTVNRSYITGDNPPPHGGATPMEDTYGTILSHSGELRTSDADVTLPSPRMPITIIRAIGNQDTYEGPFGPGWDFNYNQRLTVLDPLRYPQGLQMPLVLRNTAGNSDIAGSQDVLLHSGLGTDYHFVWKGTNLPPEYASDPLVQEFDYRRLVSDYYLPSRGLFDLLVKFADGRFERLTPDGTRYRYTSEGRLELVLDRYPNNRHELQYDSNGWLRRIDDRSVPGARYLEFGYYRRVSSDNEFQDGLDLNTANPYLEGKICRIRDYASRDVLFEYDTAGFLVRRLGVEMAGENGGYAGRSHTFYTYADCRLVGISAKADGTPWVSAVTAAGAGGKPVAQSASGNMGSVGLSIPVNNSAAQVGKTTTGVALRDGSSIQRRFDDLGNVTSETVTGSSGGAATKVSSNTVDGLEYFVRYPEGNSVFRVYDSANPVFRARGNLLRETVDPGPRGGQSYSESFSYDLRYNLQAGAQVGANGFTTTITLTDDGRAPKTMAYQNAGTRTAEFNDRGQTTRVLDPNGVEHKVTYIASTGFVDTETDGPLTYRRTYDGSVASQLGKPAAVAPALGAATSYAYNSDLQTVRVARGPLVGRTAYDELGRNIHHQEDVGDGKRKTVKRDFDEKGFITRIVTEDIEVNGVESSFENTFVPDARSRIKEAHLPGGTVKSFDYDSRGNVIRVSVGDYVEEYTYDLNNNRTEVRKGGVLVQTMQFDGFNRITNLVNHSGTADYSVQRGYYPAGQLRSELILDPAYGVQRNVSYDQLDSLGRHLSVMTHGAAISPAYQYAFSGRSMSTTGPRLSSTTTWDTAGNQVGYTDPNLAITIHRDDNGRVERIDRVEDGASYAQNFGYDDLDHQTALGDLLGTKFTYVPRADGAYLKVINARGNATTMEHSSLGEKLRQTRADGMAMVNRHTAVRQMAYTGDPGAGFTYSYDASLRMTSRSLRNGSQINYRDFDGRNLPQTMTFPGGSSSQVYDALGRQTQRTVSYQGATWQESLVYDALSRVRRHAYSQNGGVENSMTSEFDPAGPLVSRRTTEDGAAFNLAFGYYADGFRRSITYPSGVTVEEVRDNTGRLTGLADAGGPIVRATAWQGNTQPKVVELGTAMEITHEYDVRGRLTGSRVTRRSDGAVLAHLRYQYDSVNNVEIRQFVHRAGKADGFTYDRGERLEHALVGTRPLSPGGFSPADYERAYHYEDAGHDYLQNATTTNLGGPLPPFASTWEGHDAFLLPTVVDGYPRGDADALGRVAQAELWARSAGATPPQPLGATLRHDGLGQLIAVTREDGVEVQYQYQPGGLRFSKKVLRNGRLEAHLAYVYDDAGRLIEEYDRAGDQPVLLRRYYYASGDAPCAADLLDEASGTLVRHFYIRDVSQSVVAVVRADGEVRERVWYDPHGQPVIEGPDQSPPSVQSISANADGKGLLIALTESVWTPVTDPGPGGGIVRYPAPDWSGLLKVTAGTTNLSGSTQLLPSLAGHAPYSVIEFIPSEDLPEVPSALQAWWPADRAVSDVAGGNNGALAGGATNGPGLINQAFALNGSGAYVNIPDAPALNVGTNAFTVALWVNFNSLSGQQVLIEKWQQAGLAGWSLLKLADNRLRLALGAGASEVHIDSGVLALPVSAWVQYAVRRDGNQFAIFTNGVIVAQGTSALGLDSAATLKFGSREGTGSYLNGSIDEVTLFGRALQAGELTAIAGGVSVPGVITVTLNPDRLADDWGNRNATATVSFAVNNQPDTVYYSAFPERTTAAPPLGRSSVGSPFLFHGQVFDDETGLLYLRARYYDPFSGMFLEPDPLGYEDSVNLYAGMANNPASLRDPSGLRSTGVSMGGYFRFLLRNNYSMHEIHLVQSIHSELTHQGLGDLEIAAHVRVMSEDFGKGVHWEMSIRTSGHAEARMQRTEEGYQGKIEEIVNKTKDNALVEHKGKEYTGDLDGLYLLRNGEPATLEQTKQFQDRINNEMERLAPDYRKLAAEGGQVFHDDVVQKAYMHGISLNLPQEYGTANSSMPNVTSMGWKVWNNIETKMKKGTGEAFAFGMNKNGNGFDFNPSVDVNAMIKKYERFYTHELFNPASEKYDPVASERYQSQVKTDLENGGSQPLYWFPKTFYGHNYGGVQ